MKAKLYTKFGSPEVLHLKEMVKASSKDHEILIRTYATTVVKENPDIRRAPGFNGLWKPRNSILGQKLAGEVEGIGRNVTRFRLGDHGFGIVLFGTYAEYSWMSENGAVALKPANMSYEAAAGVPNGALSAGPDGRGSPVCRNRP